MIKTIVLGNGLILQIYDQSRKIAGSRWLVKMAAKIDIPIDRLHLDDNLNKQVSLKSLQETFDNFIRYEQNRERNFVGDQQKDNVFKFLITSSLLSEISAATAKLLAGLEDATEMLEDLYRRNFFLEKHERSTPKY